MKSRKSNQRMLLRIIGKALLHRRNRVMVATMALIVGAGITAALLSVYYDAGQKMSHELRRYGANLMITPAQQGGQMDESVAADMTGSGWPAEVAGATPFLYVVGEASVPNGSPTRLIVAGTRFEQFRKTSPWSKVEGKWVDDLSISSECLVGAEFARISGVKAGDTLLLSVETAPGKAPLTEPSADYSVASAKPALGVRLVVAGVLTTGSEEDNYIFVTLGAAQQVSGLHRRISAVAVSAVGQSDAIEQLASQINARFPGVRGRPIRQIAEGEDRVLTRIRLMMLLVTAVILAAAALSTSTTLTALVIERRREIGTMKAIGAEDRKLTALFLLELGGLGTTCGIAGYALGLALAQPIGRSLFSSAVSPRLVVFVVVVALTLGIALISGFVPVRRIRQVEPANILKGD
ncbi:MAG TPA: FtsX-like permease family protein [Blastocatellia bacterium]|nr:FtsX-like permease family protein [Blastocatellia bacterium]